MKNQPNPLKEIGDLEKNLAELSETESSKEQLEAEIETTTARKKRELNPKLKPLDKAEKSLKGQAIKFVKDNRKNKNIFSKGRQSIITRAGIAGFKKGRPAVKVPRQLEEEAFVASIKKMGLRHLIDTTQRVNRTRLRHAVKDGRMSKEQLAALGIRITQREHYWVKTKTAKRSRPSSAKARSRRKAIA